MATFIFKFDELPLAIVNGIEAGFVCGQAEVDYDRFGGWYVGDVSLEGFGERVNGKRQWPQVPAPDAIATIVRERLEIDWHRKVQDAVAEQFDEARVQAAE